MDNLLLKNYCMVVFLPQENVGEKELRKKHDSIVEPIKDDLLQLANTPPRYVLTKTTFMASFSSAFEPWEIRNLINDVPDRMYIIFEAEDKYFASNLPDKIGNHLFGKGENESKVEAEATTVGLEQNNGNSVSGSTTLVTLDVSTLTQKERVTMLNDLFDKGLENLDEGEKKLLDELSKGT